MTKYESKLLSKWPRHHSRGLAVFIMVQGILFFSVPFAGIFWLSRVFLFHHHDVTWDEVAYSFGVGFVFGVIKALSTWQKMERIFKDSTKQPDAAA